MLTNTAIEGAKKKEKAYMLLDGDGLYLKVLPTGRKCWVLRYWQDGHEAKKTLGVYPVMTAAEARRQRDEIKIKVKARQPIEAPKVTTFHDVAERWYKSMVDAGKAESYLYTIRLRLGYLATIDDIPVKDLTRKDCYNALLALAVSGRVATAKRTGIIISQVLDYAVIAGECEVNVAAGLNRGLPVAPVKHFDAVTETEDMRKLLIALDYVDNYVFRAALKILAYTFVRRGELLRACWPEIDLEKKIWIVPAEHTKRRRDHVVPLSTQAVRIFSDVRRISAKIDTGSSLIFPMAKGVNTGGIISNSSLLTALKGLYRKLPAEELPSQPMTLHGFRAMASTYLNRSGWPPDVIERQLAHAQEDLTRAAYNRWEYFDERTAMMQWYADALDAIKDGQPVPEKPDSGR